MRYFNVEITFTDGTTQTIETVDRFQTHEGVLYLKRDGNYALDEDLGSFPLVNVRSWKKVR